LALILLLSLGIGVLMSLLVSLPPVIRRNWTISNQSKKIQKLENNIQELQKRFQGRIDNQSNQ
jgi:Tfp pilus assembly protein PilN